MIKSFSGQVVFCFAILRAISAYVGENWLSQYIWWVWQSPVLKYANIRESDNIQCWNMLMSGESDNL